MKNNQKNVLGEKLENCSLDPLTGIEMVVVTLMKMIMDYILFVQKLQQNFLNGVKKLVMT